MYKYIFFISASHTSQGHEELKYGTDHPFSAQQRPHTTLPCRSLFVRQRRRPFFSSTVRAIVCEATHARCHRSRQFSYVLWINLISLVKCMLPCLLGARSELPFPLSQGLMIVCVLLRACILYPVIARAAGFSIIISNLAFTKIREHILYHSPNCFITDLNFESLLY